MKYLLYTYFRKEEVNFMKKIIYTMITLILIVPMTINATGGGLRSSSIKTCPDGNKYGLHSDGNGGTHWHKAKYENGQYYATGNALKKDPCPDGNTKTTTKTNVVKELSKDNSIKSIKINDTILDVLDNMEFDTISKMNNIQIELNDNNASYEFENRELEIGENSFVIIVTAENGDKKTYNLVLNRIKSAGEATIKKFVLGAGEVDFVDNKATIKKLKNESSLDYSYELSNTSARLVVYLNDKEVSKLENIKENDIIKLVVLDENDNENIYEIKVTDAKLIYTILVYGLTAMVFILPIIGVIIYFVIKNKKKKNNTKE